VLTAEFCDTSNGYKHLSNYVLVKNVTWCMRNGALNVGLMFTNDYEQTTRDAQH
jgi:hypothetical protein